MLTANERALLEWRRAALQEAQAIDQYIKGRLSLAALTVELRRAEQTRLKCVSALPDLEPAPTALSYEPSQ